eukprot:TRINITY_DN28737_c0_g2_i1.p1 TRINITY_DN28737_c0_g2~~TRINITY_DN28737_c0_g2_i1.p1  ORF type:complete len:197 (+),score=57.14 TRINITY_DN28737_c0_g2_i1:78-668(+)
MAAVEERPRIAAPGQHLGSAEELLAGRGTYAEDGGLYASLCGEVQEGEGSTLEVVPNSGVGDVGCVVPEVGATVVCHVVRMSQEQAQCVIAAVDDVPLVEKFRGVIRKQDVRFLEVDKLSLTECFRVGDFVRAQVLSQGDARSYILSTALHDGLGVIFAQSTAGYPLAPVSWQYMKCTKTGGMERRKVAKPAAAAQ